MSVKFKLDKSGRQGIISGDHFDDIRETFSVNNDAAKFMRYRSRYVPNRKYVITPGGRFDPGLTNEIIQFATSSVTTPVETIISSAFAGFGQAHPPLRFRGFRNRAHRFGWRTTRHFRRWRKAHG